MTAILATTKSLRTTVDGTLVVSFEIAPQDAPAAFTAFGLTGTCVGIAPITGDAAREATVRAASTVSDEPIKRTSEEDRHSWLELKPTAQCALLCKTPGFWQFLREEMQMNVVDEATAIGAVRRLANVESRAEFNTNSAKRDLWQRLEAKHYAWQHGMR